MEDHVTISMAIEQQQDDLTRIRVHLIVVGLANMADAELTMSWLHNVISAQANRDRMRVEHEGEFGLALDQAPTKAH